MGKKESEFVHDVLKPELEGRFPGCYILKQDPNMRQGIPDLLILCEDRWAALETKRGSKSVRQPNQEHHVATMNEMSFSAFVNPDNYHEVLNDLESALRPGR
jgi:hypothetical protein